MTTFQIPMYSTGLKNSFRKFKLHLISQRIEIFEIEKVADQIFKFLLHLESNHI